MTMSDDAPIYRCYVKGTDAETGEPRRSGNWALARRAWLRVYEDRVECGDWVIPYAEVQKAVLYEARQYLVVPVRVLHLVTVNAQYQFGVNPWARPDRRMPLEFELKRVSLGWSARSLILRLVIVGYIVWQIWQGIWTD